MCVHPAAQVAGRCYSGAVVLVRAAISRDKANCKWTSEKGIKPPPPLLPSTAHRRRHRLWQLDYTLIDCEPPFSTYTHDARPPGLRDAIAVTNPSEARTQGKESPAGRTERVYVEQRAAGDATATAPAFYMQNALLRLAFDGEWRERES